MWLQSHKAAPTELCEIGNNLMTTIRSSRWDFFKLFKDRETSRPLKNFDCSGIATTFMSWTMVTPRTNGLQPTKGSGLGVETQNLFCNYFPRAKACLPKCAARRQARGNYTFFNTL